MFQHDAGGVQTAEDKALRGGLAVASTGARAPRCASSSGSRARVRLARLACAWLIATALLAYGAVPAALAAAAGSGGGESAFSELSHGGEEEQTSAKTTASTTGSSSSNSGTSTGTVLLLGIGAAVVLLGGIAFVIMRDARSVAPVGDGPVTGRPARDPAVTMRKRRAKAKAARRQRKRNR